MTGRGGGDRLGHSEKLNILCLGSFICHLEEGGWWGWNTPSIPYTYVWLSEL